MSKPLEHPLTCEACGEVNLGKTLFCSRCTAPLTVVHLNELDGIDQRLCLKALCDTIGEFPIEPQGPEYPELWKAYLSAFWLRPETALVCYAEALAMKRLAPDCGVWMDLGSGDGIHSALYSGWRFGLGFDAFQGLNLGAADIFNQEVPEGFIAPVEREGRKLKWGVDIKRSSASRARSLGVFDQVILADAANLPVADASVDVIFSNMLRDLGDPLPGALRECRRILRDDGVLLISAMTPEYQKCLYFAPGARAADASGEHELARRLARLDRGRSVFCQRQLTLDQWDALAHENGLKVTGAEPVAGRGMIRFWDVGLRPFFTSLLRLREQWQQAGNLPCVKASALELLEGLLSPLLSDRVFQPYCMHLVRLQKAEL